MAKALILNGGLWLAGCESPPTPTPPPKVTEVAPSANVSRKQAWKDAEMLAGQGDGRVPAVGQGASMAPVYGENTMLVISQVNYDDLQPGMIVAYRNSRGFQVVHRLLEKSPRGWIAMGINNDEIDRDPVTRENLIGIVYASLVHELDTGK